MELIARGRTSDVFDLGDELVLRRSRVATDVQSQARLMRHLETYGFPVPHVVDSSGSDLVMERVHGGTLLGQLVSEPEQYERYGRLLGELHERLHRMPAPAWLRGAGAADTVIVHRDLHPENILLSERGPVVIDWDNASAGEASVDAAITVIVVLGAQLELEASIAERVDGMRSLLVDAFLRTCGTDPREGMAAAIRYRRGIPANTDAENRWLDELAPDCLDPFFLGTPRS